jgi:hypothetical protein
VRSVRDAAQNGVYDIRDARRSFAVTDMSLGTGNHPVLRWPVIPGEMYMVQGRSSLGSGAWSNQVASPWVAGTTQWEMQFADTNAPTTSKFYRITQP